MAAETSIDAHVPVALALAKLGIFYGMDVFSKEVCFCPSYVQIFTSLGHLSIFSPLSVEHQ